MAQYLIVGANEDGTAILVSLNTELEPIIDFNVGEPGMPDTYWMWPIGWPDLEACTYV